MQNSENILDKISSGSKGVWSLIWLLKFFIQADEWYAVLFIYSLLKNSFKHIYKKHRIHGFFICESCIFKGVYCLETLLRINTTA